MKECFLYSFFFLFFYAQCAQMCHHAHFFLWKHKKRNQWSTRFPFACLIQCNHFFFPSLYKWSHFNASNLRMDIFSFPHYIATHYIIPFCQAMKYICSFLFFYVKPTKMYVDVFFHSVFFLDFIQLIYARYLQFSCVPNWAKLLDAPFAF